VPGRPGVCRRRPGGFRTAGYRGRVSAVSDVRYFWHEAPVPDGLEITQVYGYLLCPRTGRVLVQDDEGTWNPGGTPEAWDADLTAAPAREAFEENQVVSGLFICAFICAQDHDQRQRSLRGSGCYGA
jgi:hypothetical protein